MFTDHFDRFKYKDKAFKWLEKNIDKTKALFKDVKLRDFIFEPFKDVFKQQDNTDEGKIKSVITTVAIVNMVLAGLPGKMGVGVAVSLGLEIWMAYEIGRQVGIAISGPKDVLKYFGFMGGILITIFEGFRHLLGLSFSMFSIIPGLNPLIFAELFVSNFVGVLFWVGFVQLKEKNEFKIPLQLIKSIYTKTKDLYIHQKDMLINTLSKENIKLVGRRIKAWMSGEIIIDKPALKGEIFPFVAMAYLVQGKYDSFNGPLGDVFIKSIRRAYSNELGNATIEEMSEYFSKSSRSSLKGHVHLVKGEMREELGEIAENTDSDQWTAELHADRTVPGSDVTFTNVETGERIVAQYKSTSNPELIETALDKYPDIPIVATSEMEKYFGDHPLVFFDGISDSDLQEVTEENFDRVVGLLDSVNVGEVVAAGVVAKATASLWPFVIAFLRKKITQDQLSQAFEKVLGEAGVSLASRMGYGLLLGTVFAWYLLARGVIIILRGAENLAFTKVKVAII